MLNNDLQSRNDSPAFEGAVAPASAEYRQKAQKAAEMFEAQFIREMFKQMRKTTREVAGEDSVFAKSVNGDMLDLADGALADQLASRQTFGIARVILNQLLPRDGNIPVKTLDAAVAQVEQGRAAGQGLSAFSAPMFPLNK
ncbi:rod-binding protein [Chromobacterium sp. IIBBL 290-4]|uniref:rod-binding protein n=1 Tax=Chromobacterium sp. IIBBL 290-4 TaxID=2953890 RepID=UPI0020B65FDF|nr:rod-binding protein [Chromobacterium sp. IIBBL 290-4]UTH72873.1 rod-binding protein [Chromobacterium sp. IIBBL 290-4]